MAPGATFGVLVHFKPVFPTLSSNLNSLKIEYIFHNSCLSLDRDTHKAETFLHEL